MSGGLGQAQRCRDMAEAGRRVLHREQVQDRDCALHGLDMCRHRITSCVFDDTERHPVRRYRTDSLVTAVTRTLLSPGSWTATRSCVPALRPASNGGAAKIDHRGSPSRTMSAPMTRPTSPPKPAAFAKPSRAKRGSALTITRAFSTSRPEAEPAASEQSPPCAHATTEPLHIAANDTGTPSRCSCRKRSPLGCRHGMTVGAASVRARRLCGVSTASEEHPGPHGP